jgi:hypothetical protein
MILLSMLVHGPVPTICRKCLPFDSHERAKGGLRVTTRGTRLAEYDRKTWAPLEKLAREHPESGVHFQGRYAFARGPMLY